MAEQAQAAEASSQAPEPKAAVYELGFHLVPTVPEDGVAAVVEKIKKNLGDAEIIAEGFPQRVRLAYEVERSVPGSRERYSEAYFGWVKFALEGERDEVGAVITALEQFLRGQKEVLRYLLIHAEREDLMQQKSRAVFASDRLEGQTLTKAPREAEKAGEVSEEELNKSLESLTAQGEV